MREAHQYPFPAFISVNEAAVRSGPGEEYYETSRLKWSERVEVYDETADYLAVRPPKGSYSWISALYVEVEIPVGTKINSKNGVLGTVVSEGLASRVGGENTEVCDTVQVKLKKGEKVLLLGELETPENHASPLWYKIAPPSGEFRWIRRSDVSEAKPDILADTYRTAGAKTFSKKQTLPLLLPPKPAQTVLNKNIPENSAPEINTSKNAEEQGQIIQVRFDETDGSTNNRQIVAEAVIPPQVKKEDVKQPKIQPEVKPSEKIAAVIRPAYSLPPEEPSLNSVLTPLDTTAFQKAFEELKDETRIVLTRPTEDWIFETLIHRGNELYEVAPTSDDLEKIYHLVETLERTRGIRKEITYRRQFKTGGLLQPVGNPLPNNQELNALPAAKPAAAAAAYSANYAANPTAKTGTIAGKGNPSEIVSALISNSEKQLPPASSFDIIGLLGEFDPLPAGHPPFAVVNEQREIVCLITPAAGLDLRSFVGQKIGINGTLGIFRKTGKPDARHITAKGVWPVP
ncbi:hypothetical protein FACS18942_01550 [Planctomycetales bacterium]|nr:hypothetical protein FACS18942_01550 [Planctomycetales bacterium]